MAYDPYLFQGLEGGLTLGEVGELLPARSSLGSTFLSIASEKGLAQISLECRELCENFSWHRRKGKRTTYAFTSDTGLPYGLHNLCIGYQGKEAVGHIDDKGLNCQTGNLFISSKVNGGMARHQVGQSGARGVSRVGNKWAAICAGEKLGSFSSKEEAMQAYNEAARKRWGKYAWLNVKR